MRQSRLIRLFKTFSSREWKTCRRYLLSQVSEDAEVIFVYDYIMHYHKDLNHKKLALDYANNALFKNKTAKNFQNVMSRLRNMVLNYIAVDHIRKDQRELKLHEMLSLNERGLYDEAIEKGEALFSLMEDQPLGIWNELFVLRGTHGLRFSDNPLKVNNTKSSFISTYESWSRLKVNLDYYYLLEAENIAKTSKADIGETAYELWQSIKPLALKEKDGIQLVLDHLLRLLVKDDDKSYDLLIDQLLHNDQSWAPNISSVVLLHLIQHQLRKIKSGTANLEDLYHLYEYGLQSGWLLDHGKISDVRFLVMIEVGCLQESPSKAKQFLERWSHTLSDQSKKEIVQLSNATIFLYSGNYTVSLDILNANTFKFGRPRNTSRELILMNYFGLYRNNADFMKSQVQNFKDYVRRHKDNMSLVQEKGLLNFANLVIKLTKGEDITEELKNVDQLVRRTWLGLQ